MPRDLHNFPVRQLGRSMWNVLSGRNVEEARNTAIKKLMQNPLIRQSVKKRPSAGDVYHDIFEDVINKKMDVPVEVLEKSKAHHDLVRQIERAQKSVGKVRRNTRLARGAALVGVGAPAALGVHALSKEGADDSSALQEYAPVAAAAGAGAYPVVQGVTSGALRPFQPKAPKLKSIQDVYRAVKPGDIILYSDPRERSTWKYLLPVTGGDPEGYHSFVAGKVDPTKGKKEWIDLIHANVHEGGAKASTSYFEPSEDLIIKRFKDKKQAREFLQNVKARAQTQEAVEKVLGERAGVRLYDKAQSQRAFLKSLLPSKLQEWITSDKARAGRAVCSTLPGQCAPVPLQPGIAGKDILPHHITTSPALETIGQYSAKKAPMLRAHQQMLKAMPWAFRGLLGAGLGYGAYRGVKAMTE